PEQLLVIHDDLDLDLGRLRIRRRGGAGGHKGVQSIIDHLGTNAFIRLRLGIGRPSAEQTPHQVRRDVVDYVLQPFEPDEQTVVADVLKRAVEAIPLIVSDRISQAMNVYNRA
ncbi:aminoacyl-tRNA hydrolase, partial [candidate division KSB3 bacterium]|nr:aminoacyl-tRNA hydrolase [candidate division KSB3 bacterium]